MKLSTRVLSTTVAITVSFTLLILLLIFQYSSNVQLTAEYAEQTEPAREAIEHLLTTIYSDFLLVEQYLLTTRYSQLQEFDQLLSHSEEQCEALTQEVDGLIQFQAITDENIINSYKTAVLVYSSWQRSRDTLLNLHKESIATKTVSQDEIKAEEERFVMLMQNSTAHFTESLQLLNQQNTQLQQELAKKTSTVQVLLLILLIAFISISIVSSYVLIQRIAKPLDDMSKASVEFTKGNYQSRIQESSGVAEISSLQQQLNRVYALIDTTFTTKDQKSQAAKQLLPPQYKEILEFITHSNTKGTSPTIKDVKKHFDLTHPTIIARLKYLEENGYIEMKKQGRNKCIVLR